MLACVKKAVLIASFDLWPGQSLWQSSRVASGSDSVSLPTSFDKCQQRLRRRSIHVRCGAFFTGARRQNVASIHRHRYTQGQVLRHSTCSIVKHVLVMIMRRAVDGDDQLSSEVLVS